MLESVDAADTGVAASTQWGSQRPAALGTRQISLCLFDTWRFGLV